MASGGGGGVPHPLRKVASAAAILVGGALTLSLATSATIRTLQAIVDAKQKKFALACGVCKEKGFYICKLCKGKSTIHWSPLYNPLVINPCLCPTCDGNSSYDSIGDRYNAVSTVWEKSCFLYEFDRGLFQCTIQEYDNGEARLYCALQREENEKLAQEPQKSSRGTMVVNSIILG
ncbi:hypothetical protein HYC85_016031 [Camellia sinensis]|uniref:Uncharacterized protein n=1 Tax=Camellia sinensis TaxID=4442 RepID=A0A7J7GYE0_CAMSI|nr:hypothetical protein HYC85_016031 [Camellia sinensis]